VRRLVVMVQREVGERLVAGPGDAAYGAVSLRVAARATASLVRRVARDVFWPRPKVDSVIVRIDRLAMPIVGGDDDVWRVVDEAFGQRRKTIRNALRRLGANDPDGALRAAGVEPSARPEELSLEDFVRLAGAIA
jgi:16S rRNA (adenine1518-N6/adenine1519-N6)-dimethyltransferase